MRVNEDAQDRYGKACMIFSKSATVPDIWEWLHKNYNGYKFAIVMDCTREEFDADIDETVVNWFGDLADEAIEANGDMVALTSKEYRELLADARKWREMNEK